jgi:hypothetical protein
MSGHKRVRVASASVGPESRAHAPWWDVSGIAKATTSTATRSTWWMAGAAPGTESSANAISCAAATAWTALRVRTGRDAGTERALIKALASESITPLLRLAAARLSRASFL